MIQLNSHDTRKSTSQPQRKTGWDLPLLVVWTILGVGCRFLNLTTKPLWTDEFATIVFSLGNNYQSVLLNQVIRVEDLLQPLQPNPDATLGDVVSLLVSQDNHPPLYFWLSHLWLQIFPLDGEYVSLWAMRSLSALLGVLSIPAIYYLGKLGFQSRLVAHFSALMMAVSPFGIYLAQEARHYTLGILGVIFSLSCLIVAVRQIQMGKVISLKLVFIWTLINCLGLGIHYFFSITLIAQGLALIIWLGLESKYLFASTDTEKKKSDYQQLIKAINKRYRLDKNARRLGLVIVATSTTALIWSLTMISSDFGHGMTDWIKQGYSFRALISPIFQLLAAWITMIALLPVESSQLWVVIISGLIMLLFFIWLIPQLYQALKLSLQSLQFRAGVQVLGGFIVSTIIIFLGITYILGIDITKGARYNFVYFPGIIVLMAVGLSYIWHRTNLGWEITAKMSPRKQGKIAVIIIILMGILSAITVNVNLGYQKYYLPDRLVQIIAANSSNPVLIATTHQSLVHTGEMMGIAWELRNHSLRENISFLLAHKPEPDYRLPTATIKTAVQQLNRPLELWVVNFSKEPQDGLNPPTLAENELVNCQINQETFPYISGYTYQQYHCY